ncbi:guanylyl cyclase [Desulfosarcina widdelii]|uniref:Guanylyl cyclase n=1 Tax=Desulfosarcina widdelii TaxID=947919 RepID=A0A5K7ZBU8_9BACT|nr:adenylate/guanylate cyclase domain-containing protein [Desulfosarcina widdelii]BBO78235.1 guanylyl cyclase [Desulfosarcina widdelii]
MAENATQRKLTAILSADVKGYSKLMGDDDETTVNTITAYRKIISGLIQKHQGRVVDTPGDNILAEFGSALNAVNGAVEIQSTLEIENSKLPENRRMVFRIGINLGDIIHKDECIYGDGVNVAARIESLAEPGGICISRGVYDQVKKKVRQGFEYLGEHAVKNINEPVRIYRILLAPEDEGRIIGEPKAAPTKLKKSASVAIAMLLIASAVLIWLFYPRDPEIESASVEKMVHPWPDKPSIAVLPFDNMSADKDQKYFSDGFTEQIITSLSKIPYIIVIARQSSFAFRDKQMTVQQIAKALGVKYILEGSIQRSNDQLRITAQLIDATSGHHIWAENYDRKIKDIFELQDEIAMKIMAGLQVNIAYESHGRYATVKTTNLKAYEKIIQGSELFLRRTEGDTLQARKLAEEAIALDPDYGIAYTLLGWTHLDDIWFYRSKDRAKSLKTAEQLAHKAIDLSGTDPTSHRLLGCVFMLRKQYEKAIVEMQKAVELSPNSASSIFFYGLVLRFAGRYDEAIPLLEKAIRLNPVTPINYLNNLAWSYALTEQYEKAIPLWNKAIERNPDYLFAYSGLTCSYQLLGNEEKAREAAAEVLRIKPTYTTAQIEEFDISNIEQKNRLLEAYHKAGIPEK